MASATTGPFRRADSVRVGSARAGKQLIVVFALCTGQGAEAQQGGSSILASGARKPVVQATITGMVQQARERHETYRADAMADVPAPAPGRGRGSLVGHLRFGQGRELANGASYTGSFNSTAFEQAGGSFAIVAQLYYQIEVPLGRQYKVDGEIREHGDNPSRIVLTAGKIDPFAFFDQNEVSDDETSGFISKLFVHNPLLDAGGDMGADRYGFTPGVRVAWFGGERHTLGASLGFLGAGRDAGFSSSPGRPFLIAQLEFAPRDSQGGTAGNYRLYGWRNPQASGVDGLPTRHVGWGVSIDQRIGTNSIVFARFGRRTHGNGSFDRALTIGVELSGSAWRLPRDAVGIAVGRLSPDRSVRSPGAQEPSPGTSASEEVIEIFYRHTFAHGIEVSPIFQAVSDAAGNSAAPTQRFRGVRFKLAF
jgi:high affinity Mn2+ porin